MARLGRKPRAIPRSEKHIRIREDIMATVDLLLLDPMRAKVKYGKRSDLIEDLLRQWIDEQRADAGERVTTADAGRVQIALGLLQQIDSLTSHQALVTMQQVRRLLQESLP